MVRDGLATDTYTTGDWDDIELAFYRGLLSDEEFQALATRHLKSIDDHLPAQILAMDIRRRPENSRTLVHPESVRLADQIRRMCISRNENVVIEGTLTWDGGPRLFRELADADDTDIVVCRRSMARIAT